MRSSALRDEPGDESYDSGNEEENTNDDDDDNLNAEVRDDERAISAGISVVALAFTVGSGIGRSGAAAVDTVGAGSLGAGSPDEGVSRVGTVAVSNSDEVRRVGGRGLGQVDGGDLGALRGGQTATGAVVGDDESRRRDVGQVSKSNVNAEARVEGRALDGRDSDSPRVVLSWVRNVAELAVTDLKGDDGFTKGGNSGGAALAVLASAWVGLLEGPVGRSGAVRLDSELEVPHALNVRWQGEEVSRAARRDYVC